MPAGFEEPGRPEFADGQELDALEKFEEEVCWEVKDMGSGIEMMEGFGTELKVG